MADCGWNPKACFIGIGSNGEQIIHELKSEWEKLLVFYHLCKEQNPQDFYDVSASPALDFYLFHSIPENSKKIDASKYHFVFRVDDKIDTLFKNKKYIITNEPVISIAITTDEFRNKRCFQNETIVILPNQGLHSKLSEFVIDLMRFCMFPRLVSFDIADFSIIHRKTVNALYFKTSNTDYEDDFRDFYKMKVDTIDSGKEPILIFFFQECRDMKNYHKMLTGLPIKLFSDHCTSTIKPRVKSLFII